MRDILREKERNALAGNRMTRAEMIRWLSDAIRVETEKPFADIDCDFVDECGALLDALMEETVLTEQEISTRVEKLKKKTAPAVHRSLKRPLRVLIAAAVVLAMGIAAMAVPFTRQYIAAALRLGVGESAAVEGITCVYNGAEKTYPTAEAFLEGEGLHFSLPRAVADTYALQEIVYAGDTNIVVLQLADPSIFYEIWLGDSNIEGFSENTTEYHFGAYTTYIAARENVGVTTYYSYTLVGDDLHCIAAPRLEDIENLIRSIG